MKVTRVLDGSGRLRWAEARGGDFFALEGGPFEGFQTTTSRLVVLAHLAPVEPTAILGVGLNYREHARETGLPLPEHPILFMKNPAALQHPGQPIRLPRSCLDPPEVDYEAELAVIIGRAALNVPEAEALSCVAGYTAANDVSARRWQKHGGGGQWVRTPRIYGSGSA
jgi:2-keto-4-pentenoate hydratase/2-oxohepta-3-ene-1,7-dioic acid hydratase in catechol pathway